MEVEPARPGIRQRAVVRTYHPRNGRVSQRHRAALVRLWPRFGVDVARTPEPGGAAGPLLDPAAVFGRRAELVLEIGPGMGDATVAGAAVDPDRDYLAVEVHTPGIANLLALVEEHGLTNVRVARGDALELLRFQIAPDSLAAVHIFFPDPWPKTRHHKRRLIRPDRVALLRSRIRPGGVLHCATDWAGYATAMLETLQADPGLVNTGRPYVTRPAWRPLTKFERLGIEAGRTIFDLVFTRVPER